MKIALVFLFALGTLVGLLGSVAESEVDLRSTMFGVFAVSAILLVVTVILL